MGNNAQLTADKPVLKRGDRGESVKALQHYLWLSDDGIFGPVTEDAVKDFQRSHKLVADGIVGSKTWQELCTAGWLLRGHRPIDEIIIHCTASREGQDFTVAQIRKLHIGNGWNDIGYHYVIYRDGRVCEGRSVEIIGAHCPGHNARSIGVCYVGGVASDGKTPKDTRTPQQKDSLKRLVRDLMSMYDLKPGNVHGHNEFAAKACPSFDVRKEIWL